MAKQTLEEGRLMLNTLIDYLQAKFPPAKVVTAAAPFILLGSGYASTWCAQHLPGLPHFSAAQGLLVAAPVVLGVASILYKRIDGWQKHDAHGIEIAKAMIAAGHHVEVDGKGTVIFPQNEPDRPGPDPTPSPLIPTAPPAGQPPKLD